MALPIIPGETVTPGVFNRRWISYLSIYNRRMGINLLPYDGAGNVLLAPVTSKLIKDVTSDPVLSQLVTTIKTKMKELANQQTDPLSIIMIGTNPMAAVRITATFAVPGQTTPAAYVIPDIFEFADTNPEFASIVGSFVGWVAANL